MTRPSEPASAILSFGRFALSPGERLLTADGSPVELGARTLDTLIALASRPNQVVGKRELMAEVWPDVTVDEGSLRFHIASLRKVLGDGKDGARFITTLAGRGYCFVAPVARVVDPVPAAPPKANDLPALLTRMVGRSEGVRALSAQVVASRFVTIVGSGGVGKTTVAIAVAHDLLEEFAGVVVFVDFGALRDPALVPGAVASMLGVSVQSDDPIPSLTAHLRDKRMLLILDNCEHVIDAAARLAAALFAAASQLHILATSREALRIEGEQVHRLLPLGVPPDDPALTAPVAMTYPAMQLFVERAAASGAALDLTDADAITVANICRRLDGVALAIELAAGRVPAYGLRQTASLLDQHLSLSWQGLRTAPPRQQTLQATLDWSYGLLSETERVVFRRLGVFVGSFTLRAALAVVTGPTVAQAQLLGALESLVAKSLVAARPVGTTMRYRLLDTTRAYALGIDVADSERTGLAARHAIYCRQWLEQSGPEWAALSNAAEREPYLARLGGTRAALEWCFGIDGDPEIGVGLAAAAVPVLLAMSLLTECHRWAERALLAIGDAMRGGPEEMRLQAALGLSLMFTQHDSGTVRAALTRGLECAERCGDSQYQLQILGGLHLLHERIGAFAQSLAFAQRSAVAAEAIGDPVAIAAAHSWLGISHHLMGDLEAADSHLQIALASPRVSQRFNTIQIGFDYHYRARIARARNLWLRGYPDQAARVARETVAEAAALDHPVTLCMALIWAVTVFAWRRDMREIESHIDRFGAIADRYALTPYQAASQGVRGAMAIRRGDVVAGVESLQLGLKTLGANGYELLATELVSVLAEGQALDRRFDAALATIDQAIQQSESFGRLFTLPELLRIQGWILSIAPNPDGQAVEACLLRSLALSRRQTARGWELRTAIDLAALWARNDRLEDARSLLQPVLAKFTEGKDTADLVEAERLLATL
jgi:predicted ATPase/DNA-binding winged helix-turn-helix (wHTH) protein